MTRLRRSHRVAQVVIDDPVATVAASIPSGRAVVLQDGSEVIWYRLPDPDQPAVEASHLAAELAEETGVDVVVMEEQILNLVTDLAEEGLVDLL